MCRLKSSNKSSKVTMPACVVACKSRIRISSNFFLSHLQNVTVDTDADRIRRGIEIRRPKKKRNSQNDMRIKSCIERYDNGAFSRLQFLKSISHSLGVHTEAFQVIGTLMLVTTSQSSTPPPPAIATSTVTAVAASDDIVRGVPYRTSRQGSAGTMWALRVFI